MDNGLEVDDDRYKFEKVRPTYGEKKFAAKKPRISESLEVEAFVTVAMGSSRIPVEIFHPQDGEPVSLPKSELGQTHVRWAGKSKPIFGGYDEYNNLLVYIFDDCALEVIYNSRNESDNSVHGKKKIIFCS